MGFLQNEDEEGRRRVGGGRRGGRRSYKTQFAPEAAVLLPMPAEGDRDERECIKSLFL